jgi:hypothetical protein
VDAAGGVAVDRFGNAHVAGVTYSADFPSTQDALDPSFNGNSDAFAAKLDASGPSLRSSTFLGGSWFDFGRAVALDRRGQPYVTGDTGSSDFPTTPGSFDTTFNGAFDAFVSKLDATGSVLGYSTFLGGSSSDVGKGLVVDTAGKAYATGYTSSANFPTSRRAFDRSLNGESDAFLARLNAGGSVLSYGTYVGGTAGDFGSALAVERSGRAHVAGDRRSADFPATPGAFDTTSTARSTPSSRSSGSLADRVNADASGAKWKARRNPRAMGEGARRSRWWVSG